MRHLTIVHFGPIEFVDFEIKRFNFFIGPQSSGKSTIAKVISTCEWIEKEVATTMNEKAVSTVEEFRNLLMSFHRMYGYFYDDTKIHYVSDVVSILYSGDALDIELKSKDLYERRKISYMPAERNMITSPEMSGFEFGQTSLRSFLFDWFSARELYTANSKISILDFDVQYYFDPSESRFKDRIEHINGVSYNIPLNAASSGLQSVVPLQVMLDYYSDRYFATYEHRTSFDYDAKTEAIRKNCVVEYVLKKYYNGYTGGYEKEVVADANRKVREGDEKMLKLAEEYRHAFDRLTIPARIEFIIEEPEQNLYPFAQVALLEKIVEIASNGRGHGVTITTHSPFILSYINILLLRNERGVAQHPALNPLELNAFAVQDGKIVDLVQVNSVTGKKSVNAEDLVEAMRTMYDEYKGLKLE